MESDSGSENESPNKTVKSSKKKFKRIASDTDSDEDQSISKKDLKNTIKSFTFKQQTNKEDNDESNIKHEFDVKRDIKKTVALVDIHNNWLHNKLEFLKPDKIKDANMRSPKDPQYNPRTLYVPDSFLKGLTPAMYQWWKLKSDHFDCVLFFKVGKFYELYHMDAVIGVKELGFSYMKVNF